jgi:GMP synthase PP-ATPase subunit
MPSNVFTMLWRDLTDPEKKRKAIGRVFIEVFDDASHEVEGCKMAWPGYYLPGCYRVAIG